MSVNMRVFEKRLTTPERERIAIDQMKEIYLLDERPFMNAFSGGKDSHTSTDLLVKSLLELKKENRPLSKPVFVTFSDTGIEMDPVINDIDDALDRLEAFSEEQNLPIEIMRVKPETKDSFASLVFGAGYVLIKGNKWCTQRWKILPQERAIKKILGKYKGFIAITGQRIDESVQRAKVMKRYSVEDSILKQHDNPNCALFAPIEEHTSNDVWSYLYTRALPWVDSVGLGKLYADASSDGDECRQLLEGEAGETPGCGKSGRFGCQFCWHLTQDKSLMNLVQHHPYMGKIEEYRNELIKESEDSGWMIRDVYMHGKNIQNIYNRDNHREGMTVPGGYTLKHRQKMLKRYIELDLSIIDHRRDSLVSDEELTQIQERWIEEGECELSVYKIAPHRSFPISKKHKEVLAALLIYKKTFYSEPDEKSMEWYHPHWPSMKMAQLNRFKSYKDARYFAQLSLQLQKKGRDPIFFAELLTGTLELNNSLYPAMLEEAMHIISTLPVETTQYYPDENEQEYVRWEWKNDRVGLHSILKRYESGKLEKPKPTLFGYEGDYDLQFEQLDELEEKGDITLCESISLQDQMAILDNW